MTILKKSLAFALALPLAACLAPEPDTPSGDAATDGGQTTFAISGEGFSGTFETIDCDTGLCLALASGTAPGVSALSIATWNDVVNPATAVFADSGTRYLFFNNGRGVVERDGVELASFTHTFD